MDSFEKFKETIKDPNIMMFEARKRKKDIMFWSVLIVVILTVYFLLSNKDYSFLLVLSSLTQMFSFIIILIKVYTFQSCSGLSYNSLICYLIILFSRLTSTITHHGYLPADTSGDWFYQLTEIVALLCCAVLIYMLLKPCRDTADFEKDSIDYKYLVIPCIVLALLIHPRLNKNLLTDTLWTLSMYLEGVAIFPQLYLFKTKSGIVESYTSHYVALQGLSRLFSLFFWWDTHEEVNDIWAYGYSFMNAYVGYFVLFSQVLQLLIMMDYYFYYFKSIWRRSEINMDMI